MRRKGVKECDIYLVILLWSKEQQPVMQQRTSSATSTKLKSLDVNRVTWLNIKPFKRASTSPGYCQMSVLRHLKAASLLKWAVDSLVHELKTMSHVYVACIRLMVFSVFWWCLVLPIQLEDSWYKEMLVELSVPCLFS